MAIVIYLCNIFPCIINCIVLSSQNCMKITVLKRTQKSLIILNQQNAESINHETKHDRYLKYEKSRDDTRN